MKEGIKPVEEKRISDEAIEAVARERWMQERVEARIDDLVAWDYLTEETREQKLHQARQLLEAALPHLQATPPDGRISVELTVNEEEAIRHELAEPYGQQIRADVIDKLRAALAQYPMGGGELMRKSSQFSSPPPPDSSYTRSSDRKEQMSQTTGIEVPERAVEAGVDALRSFPGPGHPRAVARKVLDAAMREGLNCGTGDPDISVGDVIAAEEDGTIILDDGITTWNPTRATRFLLAAQEKKLEASMRERLLDEADSQGEGA